jgi:tRNA (adenine-N(1)-)-methyltransferase non-catalytic subunit
MTLFRFSKTFATIEPTLFNVCEYWYKKDQNRLRDIRADALSQILNLASVGPGGRYLVVDEASGILVAGVLDRLGGNNFPTPSGLVLTVILVQGRERS